MSDFPVTSHNLLDSQEQMALFGENPGDYQDIQWNYITDSNSTSQNLSFDNLALVSQLCTVHDAFILAPVTIAGTNFSSSNEYSRVAFQNGTEALITSVQLQLATGSQIVNDTDGAPLINTFRKLIEYSDDKLRTVTGEELFWPDDLTRGILVKQAIDELDSGSDDGTLVNRYNIELHTQAVTDTAVSTAALANKGHFMRAKALLNNAIRTGSVSSTAIVGWVKIPLRNIHPVFKNWTKPIVNMRMTFNFGLAGPFNTVSNYRALTVDTSTLAGSASTLVSSGTGIGGTTFTPGASRLYFKCITLNPRASMLLADMTANPGYKYRHNFTSVKGVTKFSVGSTNTIGQTQIGSNIANAVRLVIAGYAQNTHTPWSNSNVLTWSTVPASRLANCTLYINQQPVYIRTYSSDYEHFLALKAQTSDAGLSGKAGSLITYEAWLAGTQLYYVFDLSRLGKRFDFTQPCTFAFEGTRTAHQSTTIDYVATIECEEAVDINISNTSVTVHKVL